MAPADRSRAKRDDRPSAWGPRLRVALGVIGVGALLVLAGIVMGRSLRGFSTGTTLHLIGVLALLAGCGMAAGPALRFARTDARGKPIIGLVVLFVLIAGGWLVDSIVTETSAGDLWEELTAKLEVEGPAASQGLINRFEDIPEPELRVKYVKRLGELGDKRSASFLLDLMETHEEAAVRDAAAVGYGRVAEPLQIDKLIEKLAEREDATRRRILTALRTAAGANHGNVQDGWIRWRLGEILAEGTPDAVERVIQRLGRLTPRQSELGSDFRRRLVADARPEHRAAFEKCLRGHLTGRYLLERRYMAVLALGRIASPASIEALKGAARWALERSREKSGEEKLSLEQLKWFWDAVGQSLRAIAGSNVLDEKRHAPVYRYFMTTLADPDPYYRNFAADHLQAMSGHAHGLDAAKWKGWHEAKTVEAWVEEKNTKALIVELRRQTAANDLERGARAVRALIEVDHEDGRKVVRALAMNRSAEVKLRTIALAALADRQLGIGRDDLTLLLGREEDIPMIRATIDALAIFDESPVAKALHKRFLVEENVEVRRSILSTLRKMTADAVLPALIDAVRDELPHVAEGAAEELRKRSGKRFGVEPEKWEEWYKEAFD